MQELNQKTEAPSVQLNIEDGSATYLFREQSYILPGTYNDIDAARADAEEQCRGLGWSGPYVEDPAVSVHSPTDAGQQY
ncbi:hypothetical protein [Neorhizobium sp. JUb45]|uniref:hypothetical protein n=1 Tax=Neorhizobium sp. JUb45 TaxID=2485113 RepID=UPI00104CEB8B|nr:hypothetical protein [Neorhizobium sp. JUb45]TCQ95446.1 hypothetical protein EDF70_12215 [Neorhizobium sp. JUb45]